MKYIITLLVVVTIIVLACNTNKNSLFSKPGDLTPDEYSINTDRDTTLVTKNGALLKIPKGALSSKDGNTVVLEINEAYTIEQMIASGLTTTSGEELLSSGGMIYINAKDGQDVTINQPIKVALPSEGLTPGMQLFKGVEDNDGNINWTAPDTLPENHQLTVLEKGQQLFASKCASCHKIGADMTGPNLAHILYRFPPDKEEGGWKDLRYLLHGFIGGEDMVISVSAKDTARADTIESPNAYLHEGYYRNERFHHPSPYYNYKCNLLKMNWASSGPGFDFQTDSAGEDFMSVLRFIQNESDLQQLPLPDHAYLLDCADSCYAYDRAKMEIEKRRDEINSKRTALVNENGPMVKEKINPILIDADSTIDKPMAPVNFEERVSPKNFDAEYYQFTIESFGWYNIDILTKDMDGVEESELFVRLTGEYTKKVQTYLIIPSSRIYVQGGPAERNAAEFAYEFKNGKINLPQNTKAYILALSENSSSVQYAIHEFTTSTKQEFELSLQSASKSEFNKAMKKINGEELKIRVDKSKNAKAIKKEDKKLENLEEEREKVEKLKPVNCNCDCMYQNPPSVDYYQK